MLALTWPALAQPALEVGPAWLEIRTAEPFLPSSLELELDGRDVSRQAVQAGAVLRLSASGLEPGRHRLLFRARRPDQGQLEQAWTFELADLEATGLPGPEPDLPDFEPVDPTFDLAVEFPDPGQAVGAYTLVRGRTRPRATVKLVMRRLVDVIPGTFSLEWGRREQVVEADLLGRFSAVLEAPEASSGERLELRAEALQPGRARSREVRLEVYLK